MTWPLRWTSTMNESIDALQLDTTEADDGSLVITWNENHPAALEVLNHWSEQDWIDVFTSAAGRTLRLWGDEPTDLW